jgi:hypothetical protein
MRRMSAALVAITAAIALVALAAPAWPKAKPKAKPKPWALVVSPSEVQSGQMVTVSGGGCQGTSILKLFIDKEEFHSTSAKSGKFRYQVRLPRGLESGSHDMSASCRGSNHTLARFNVKDKNRYGDDGCEEGYQNDEDRWSQVNVRHGDDENDDGENCEDGKDWRRASFNVSPDVVIAGDKVWAEGTGCKRYSPVTIKLDGWPIRWTYADRHGTFDKGIRLPRDIRRGRHLFSAKCGGRHIGSDGIKVKKEYKQHPWGVYSNGSVVRAGKKLRIRGDDCPYGAPTAKLDHTRLHLNVLHKDKGFTAEASRRSRAGSESRSSWMPSRPSCWLWSTRPWPRPGRPCGWVPRLARGCRRRDHRLPLQTTFADQSNPQGSVGPADHHPFAGRAAEGRWGIAAVARGRDRPRPAAGRAPEGQWCRCRAWG